MDWMRQVLPFQRTAKLCGEGDAVPTATQTRLVGHDTPFRNSAVVAGGLGVGWIFQPPPTHRSANIEVGAWGVPDCPTAVQTRRVAHDTPPKELLAAKIPVLGGLGVGWSCQLVPFQRSANGEVEIGPGSPETVKEPPTATQARLDGHDTPLNIVSVAPGGLGVGWIVQAAPFQRSDNGNSPDPE